MLSYQTIAPHTLALLKRLMEEPRLAGTRLVGGTSLALQYGHRCSIDLDIFGSLDDDIYSTRDCLDAIGNIQIIKETRNIRIYVVDGVKVDFVDYSRYKWIAQPIIEEGLRLASDIDIAAMKVNAIEGRGTRKDFIDLYFLLQHYSLKEILDFYEKKYPEHSLFRALMSLSYFDDAEKQMMPKMLVQKKWEEMKVSIMEAIENLAKSG